MYIFILWNIELRLAITEVIQAAIIVSVSVVLVLL